MSGQDCTKEPPSLTNELECFLPLRGAEGHVMHTSRVIRDGIDCNGIPLGQSGDDTAQYLRIVVLDEASRVMSTEHWPLRGESRR